MTTTKKFEMEQQSFHDGKIVIYKRPNLKNPVYQVRVKIPNGAGYIIKPTKTRDLFEARR